LLLAIPPVESARRRIPTGGACRVADPAVTSAGAICVMLWNLRRLFREVIDLRTGLMGERYIGNFLQNSLLRRGSWVVHDISGQDGNIDHALIAPGGVLAVETKTRTKPARDARVGYDGRRILVQGFEHDREPQRRD
jgi:hypothetical protein